MHPVDLEALVDRELRQLPPPGAPQTLLPRVMAAVQAWAARPWYSRAWFTWPVWGQVASIAALSLLLAGVVIVLPAAQHITAGAAAPFMSTVVSKVVVARQSAAATASAIGVIWRTVLEPVVRYAFAIVLLMCLACVACGAAFNRLVLERAWQ